MNRSDIYANLEELRPYIALRECTPRVMAPVDALLDQLIQLQAVEYFTDKTRLRQLDLPS